MPDPLTSRQLCDDLRACGPDVDRATRALGQEIPQTWASIDQAKRLNVDLLWLGCRLADDQVIADFVTFTVTQRATAVEALAGAPVPADDGQLRQLAATAWEEGQAGDAAARLRAIALRELARDRALTAPDRHQAREASRAALRVILYAAGADPAGSVHETAKDAQIEWLAEQLIGARR